MSEDIFVCFEDKILYYRGMYNYRVQSDKENQWILIIFQYTQYNTNIIVLYFINNTNTKREWNESEDIMLLHNTCIHIEGEILQLN